VPDWLSKQWPNAAAFLWGLAEATLFFIVPDVVLSYIGLTRGARAAAVASLYAAAGASLGGALMYLWSARDFAAAAGAVRAVPAISDAMAADARAAMAEHGWFLASLAGPLSSTPYKLYAILAPHAGAPLVLFTLASIAARLPRFLLVGAGVAWIGARLRPRIGPRGVLWLLAAAWLAFYALFFAVMPS
jgi:membrane protein YqaA with SNARE-associated domain